VSVLVFLWRLHGHARTNKQQQVTDNSQQSSDEQQQKLQAATGLRSIAPGVWPGWGLG
jgi:hypothetical protein